MSTVDWPKNICTVIFFAGCDFRCPYCQNSELITPTEDHRRDIRDIKREIRKNLDFIDGVLFSGGEATLQRQALIEIAGFVKKLGRKVGLETNGGNPGVVEFLIQEGLLDFVGMDLKAPLDNPELFAKATKAGTFFRPVEEVMGNVKATLDILSKATPPLEVEIRTTIVPRLVYRKEDVQAIASCIAESAIDARWSLQQFRSDLGKVLDPMFQDLDYPKRAFLEQLRDHCLKMHPNLRIDVKAV